MDIKEVSVEVGEVRNHPFEYGNYRASVRLTARIEESENDLDVTHRLRGIARMHALEECDQWEEQIREEHRIEQAISRLIDWENRVSRWGHTVEDAEKYYMRACEMLEEANLPDIMHKNWADRLKAALDIRIEAIEAQKTDEEAGYIEPPDSLDMW